MKKCVIVGCGFSGLAAAEVLSHARDIELLVIEQKKTFDFLPLLPDVIGRSIPETAVSLALGELSEKFHFRLINEPVVAIDFRAQRLQCSNQEFFYDFLILAAGSKTNFYGNKTLEAAALKLDTLEDAQRIQNRVQHGHYENFVVVGGGYTGIEIATNIWRSTVGFRRKPKIYLVEKGPCLLAQVPEWIRTYTFKNLQRIGIEIILNASVAECSGGCVSLAGGQQIKQALLIWSAGVTVSSCAQNTPYDQSQQGRLIVNDFLQVDKNVLVAGDCAAFLQQGRPIRMTIQFALTQGRLAGRNIQALVQGKPLGKFIPFDPGYIIPMANNKSCGYVLGLPARGTLPTILHYSMCIFRTRCFSRKLALTQHILFAQKKFLSGR